MSYRQFAANAVVNQSASRRLDFIKRTYVHLAGAILAFAVLCGFFLSTPLAANIASFAYRGTFQLILFFGAFMFSGSVAQKWAYNATSRDKQYLGLGLYVVTQAVFFSPMLLITAAYSDPTAISSAAIMTAVVFGGLTFMTLYSKQDFSFLGRFIQLGLLAAFGVALCSVLFGITVGTWFAAALVVLAAGSILYETSAIMRTYPEDAHVAAALNLFSSVTLLFWYLFRLFADRD
jgi:FtsH-binding integral membrane protein